MAGSGASVHEFVETDLEPCTNLRLSESRNIVATTDELCLPDY